MSQVDLILNSSRSNNLLKLWHRQERVGEGFGIKAHETEAKFTSEAFAEIEFILGCAEEETFGIIWKKGPRAFAFD